MREAIKELVHSLNAEGLKRLIRTLPTDVLEEAPKDCPSPGCEFCIAAQEELAKRAGHIH